MRHSRPAIQAKCLLPLRERMDGRLAGHWALGGCGPNADKHLQSVSQSVSQSLPGYLARMQAGAAVAAGTRRCLSSCPSALTMTMNSGKTQTLTACMQSYMVKLQSVSVIIWNIVSQATRMWSKWRKPSAGFWKGVQ